MARAKIFKRGGSQAVRPPKEFRFDVNEVDVRREGDAVILEPARARKQTAEELKALMGGDRRHSKRGRIGASRSAAPSRAEIRLVTLTLDTNTLVDLARS